MVCVIVLQPPAASCGLLWPPAASYSLLQPPLKHELNVLFLFLLPLGVGQKTITDAILSATGASKEQLKRVYKKTRETGEARNIYIIFSVAKYMYTEV